MEIKYKLYFINFVRDGIRIFVYFLIKKVGSGLSKYDFVVEEVIILKIFFLLVVVKLLKWVGDFLGYIGWVNCVVKV